MKNIIICGFMGAGKTVVGRELAKMMGCRFIDTDELIEKEQGVAIKAIFATRGEDYFRELEYETCKKIGETKNCVVSTGGGALTFKRNVEALKKSGKIVFLDASFDTICERIGDNQSRPLFQDKEKARALYDERKSKYLEAADYVIDGDLSARMAAIRIAEIFK
ncbi:MAG: shikimate kinase [Eubacterium sp.]|nr:shikimate kinase [Eubacterium sp.]